MKKQYKKIVDVAVLAGKIMLESHAESYRVEDTVRRILQLSGLSVTEVITYTTGLYITLDDNDPEIEPYSLVRRITDRSNQLNKIYRVNAISRQLTQGSINIEQAHAQLLAVDESEYTAITKDLATIILVMAFVALLGGGPAEILFSILTGAVVAYSRVLKHAIHMNQFIFGVASTLITAFMTNIIVSLLSLNVSTDIIIIASLMPLYPGTSVMNGLRDILKGDYVSGLARVSEAMVIALSLAIGVAIGLALFGEVAAWIA